MIDLFFLENVQKKSYLISSLIYLYKAVISVSRLYRCNCKKWKTWAALGVQSKLVLYKEKMFIIEKEDVHQAP